MELTRSKRSVKQTLDELPSATVKKTHASKSLEKSSSATVKKTHASKSPEELPKTHASKSPEDSSKAIKKIRKLRSESEEMNEDFIVAHNTAALAVRAEYTRVNDHAAVQATTLVKKIIKSKNPIELTVLLYSGRFSPPQNAHLEIMRTINTMLTLPLHVGIISLGDGVKGNTTDSPIPFELKKQIFKDHRAPFKTEHDFENVCALIRGNVFVDSTRALGVMIDSIGREKISSIKIIHFAGNKENGDKPSDDTKLSGVSKFLQTTAGDIPVEYNTYVVSAITLNGSGESVSASRVRDDARSMNEEDWIEKYTFIYGKRSNEIYDAIIHPEKQEEELKKGYDIKTKSKTISKPKKSKGGKTRRLQRHRIFYKRI